MPCMTYTYQQPGPQRPVFLCPHTPITRFWVEGEETDVQLAVSYDPPGPRMLWMTHEGALADQMPGITAIKLRLQPQAKPVRLMIEQREG